MDFLATLRVTLTTHRLVRAARRAAAIAVLPNLVLVAYPDAGAVVAYPDAAVAGYPVVAVVAYLVVAAVALPEAALPRGYFFPLPPCSLPITNLTKGVWNKITTN